MSAPPFALLRDTTSLEPRWWRFERPVEVLAADRLPQVTAAIERVSEAVDRGLFAVGFLSYEAAPAFDAALDAHEQCPLPLAWFGLFVGPIEVASPIERDRLEALEWRSTATRGEHAEAIAQVREAIAAGSTYQVNLTHRLRAAFSGDPLALLHRLYGAQPTPYAAYLDLGRHVVVSASPELFFSQRGERLVTRPMKGTAPRGRSLAEDRIVSERLRISEKERSENLMIVDMARNDLGRIAIPGTVEVPRLFGIESYDTVLQMVSEVEARSDRSLGEILRALFPAASITGAPKASTTGWIRRLERTPRGIYTGAIGTVRPGRQIDFSVAIRTAHVDRELERVEYGTGGGIVWDSDPDAEWRETRTKALILARPAPAFELLETLYWSPQEGFRHRDLHLERLSRSASYFRYPLAIEEIDRRLEEAVNGFDGPRIARLRITREGAVRIDTQEFAEARWSVGVATEAVSSTDRFLFHKTTHRAAYDRALASAPDADEALLWNERHEWTESTRANLVVVSGGRHATPPIECGLLAGTEREHRLRTGGIVEARVTDKELLEADEIYLINSVRGRIDLDAAAIARAVIDLRAERDVEA